MWSTQCSTCCEGKVKGKRKKKQDELELAQMSESLQAGRWQVLRMFRSSEPSRIVTLKSLRNYREIWRLVQRG